MPMSLRPRRLSRIGAADALAIRILAFAQGGEKDPKVLSNLAFGEPAPYAARWVRWS